MKSRGHQNSSFSAFYCDVVFSDSPFLLHNIVGVVEMHRCFSVWNRFWWRCDRDGRDGSIGYCDGFWWLVLEGEGNWWVAGGLWVEWPSVIMLK